MSTTTFEDRPRWKSSAAHPIAARQKIAVIGAGISGNLAARLLSARHEVHLFEAHAHLGGHTRTVRFELGGQSYVADTGFMVFNDRTYPNFLRMLALLDVPARTSDMSFSVRCVRTGWEYQGSSLNGLFADRRNLLRLRFYRMLADILRFNRAAMALANDGSDTRTLQEFLSALDLGCEFKRYYLYPMTAAIWSARPDDVENFPAFFLARFFRNHGLLQLRDRPVWKTVQGGAHRYVQQLLAPLHQRVYANCPVQTVRRSPRHVTIFPRHGPPQVFDRVVLATHPDQALQLLDRPTATEKSVLGCFRYQENKAVLHTDRNLLPKRRRAWASWNYHLPAHENGPATLTYNLNRLQGLSAPEPVCVTLNEVARIDTRKIIRRLKFRHPVYNIDILKAQSRFAEISGRHRTHFCGAYWGYGFHEDGVNSALAVARQFGLDLEDCTAASTAEPSGIVARAL